MTRERRKIIEMEDWMLFNGCVCVCFLEIKGSDFFFLMGKGCTQGRGKKK